MITKTLVQARDELGELLNRVTFGKERVVVTRHGKPIAAFIPIDSLQTLEKLEQVLDIEKAQARLAEIEAHGTLTLEEIKVPLGVK